MTQHISVPLYLDILKSKTLLATDANGLVIDGSSVYVPYTGASSDVDLGSKNFSTTGTLGAGAITGTSFLGLKENIVFGISGGGAVITTGIKQNFRVPYNCTITGWTLLSNDDTSGSITIDIWKDSYANYPPTNADSITNGHEPSISASTKGQDLDVADWSGEALTGGDILRFNVDSVTDLKSVTLILHITTA